MSKPWISAQATYKTYKVYDIRNQFISLFFTKIKTFPGPFKNITEIKEEGLTAVLFYDGDPSTGKRVLLYWPVNPLTESGSGRIRQWKVILYFQDIWMRRIKIITVHAATARPYFNIKIIFQGLVIPIIEARWSWDHPLLLRWHIYNETTPWWRGTFTMWEWF